ncbi:MAG: ATP synthase F0 subunit B [Proteobacteria bacterium]|nr:ATP synthase F0 subunit B [Pseudomonadota bacterium]
MLHLAHDPKFWLAVSFLIFVALFAKYAWPFILKMIDGKKFQIIDSIEQAKQMKVKAEELLVKAEKYHHDSIAYSQKLIEDAKNEAQSLIKESQKLAQEELDRKINLSKQRIKQEEENAIREVKGKIIISAIQAIEKNIASAKGDKSLKTTIDKAIVDVSKLVH